MQKGQLQFIMLPENYYQSDKQKLMNQSKQSLNKRNSDLQIKYYRKSQRIKNLFSKDEFDLRFNEIRNSLVDYSFFRVVYHIIRWRVSFTNLGIPDDQQKLSRQLPIKNPTFPVDQNKITYTWLGHSTAVISFGRDANFIIDPVFSQRCSPYQWIGPKRFRPVPCSVQQLPKIDAVLVSHDHYDHLDENSLQRLYNRNNNCLFFAGLHSQSVFPQGCRMNTMDWTQTKQIQINKKIFKITFVPVCHWSRRGMFDKNYRLWGGFVIEAPSGKKVFYSGDTGYCGIFQELGKIFNGFDLSILPIGAYLPREYLKNQHIDPQQAVKVHKQLKSKKSVGVHWGTFPLGYEHYIGAREDLKTAIQKQRIKQQDFITVDHGGHFQINYL